MRGNTSVKVLVSMRSELSGDDAVPAAGELTVAGNVLSAAWTQPPTADEHTDSLYQLSYDKPRGVLRMIRTGDNTTDLSFSGTERTQAALSTPYGDFSMEIETLQMSVPDELWQFAGEHADLQVPDDREKSILLRYFLHISGQEPMENDIAIQISLVKNGN